MGLDHWQGCRREDWSSVLESGCEYEKYYEYIDPSVNKIVLRGNDSISIRIHSLVDVQCPENRAKGYEQCLTDKVMAETNPNKYAHCTEHGSLAGS